MSRAVFREPKRAGGTVTLPVDFAAYMNPGVTITGQVVTASLYSGIDANPSLILSGVPTVVGTVVKQNIGIAIAGNIYELLFAASLSDGQAIPLAGYLYVEPDLP